MRCAAAAVVVDTHGKPVQSRRRRRRRWCHRFHQSVRPTPSTTDEVVAVDVVRYSQMIHFHSGLLPPPQCSHRPGQPWTCLAWRRHLVCWKHTKQPPPPPLLLLPMAPTQALVPVLATTATARPPHNNHASQGRQVEQQRLPRLPRLQTLRPHQASRAPRGEPNDCSGVGRSAKQQRLWQQQQLPDQKQHSSRRRR